MFVCYRYTPQSSFTYQFHKKNSTTTTIPAPVGTPGVSASFVVFITIKFNAQDAAVRFRFFEIHMSTTRAYSSPPMITLIQP